MEKTFDLSNVGCVNRFYAQDEASVIHSAMTQEEKILSHIKHEITQLIETRKVVEEDLVRFRIGLAPQHQPFS